MSLLGSVLLSLAVLWVGRAMPLQGPRRFAVLVARLLAVWCAILALRGWSLSKTQEQPRHIVYLLDQSRSIDAAQTAWMARDVASLEARRPRHVSRAVLAFGAQAAEVVPSGTGVLDDPDALARRLRDVSLDRDDTNLEAALLAALASAPQPQRPGPPTGSQAGAGTRVILLSDGRQTAGDVERILPHIRRLGLEVYPEAPPSTVAASVTWEELSVPSVVRRGSAVPLRLVFTNGTSAHQVVDVAVGLQGLSVARKRVRLSPGWHVVSLAVPAEKSGSMELEVVAGPSGTPPERRTAMVDVEGPPKLLMVLERPGALPLLGTALKRRGLELSVITPSELPTEPGRLLEYDAVMCFQVPKSAVSRPQVDALTDYVSRFGGGVLMVGLGGVLHQEIAAPAPLDALLPVVFEPKGAQEAKRRVCMLMLIDRSASMMGPRIAATKRAAVELVKQLAPEDLVGVLAFDTLPYVVVEVQPARRVTDTLIDKLVYLKSTGGTDIFPALEAAQGRLQATGATVQHVILLSDGMTPLRSAEYRRLLGEMKAGHITLSTVGVGAGMVNVDLLQWLAQQTGGTFYQMRDLNELPKLIAVDTQQALGRLPFTEGDFLPQRAPSAQWFEDVAAWPSLRGYVTATAKPGAAVELTVTRGRASDPLLVHWAVGKGRVTAFTSDAGPRWSAGWIRWPAFDATWAEIVHQTMRRRPEEDVFVWLDEQDGRPSIVVEGDLRDPAATLVSRDGSVTTPLPLVQQGRFRWRAPAEALASGWYRVVIEDAPNGSSDSEVERNGRQATASSRPSASDRGAGFVRRWVQIGRAPGPSGERQREQAHLPADEPLLRRMSEATHGAYHVPDRAFLPPTEWVRVAVPLRGLLLPLMLLVALVDVWLRGRTML